MTAIVKKPEKGLAIKLDELVIPKHVTGTQADDPILKFASQIENKTLTDGVGGYGASRDHVE